MLACESDSVETVEALLRGGANTQLDDAIGHKATEYAATAGNQHIMQMLQDGAPPGTVWGLEYFFILRDFTWPSQSEYATLFIIHVC